MTVALGDVQADCGEVYDNLNNGTTAAGLLITKANTKIVDITGTTTGFDSPIRNIADFFICNQVLGSSSATDLGIGPIRVGRSSVKEMRDAFLDEAKSTLAKLGYTLNTANLLMGVVNQ